MTDAEKDLGFQTVEEARKAIKQTDKRLFHLFEITKAIKNADISPILEDLANGDINEIEADELIKDAIMDEVQEATPEDVDTEIVERLEEALLLHTEAIEDLLTLDCPYILTNNYCPSVGKSCTYCWAEYMIKVAKGEA